MQIPHRNLKPLTHFSTCSKLMLTILYFHLLTWDLYAQALWNLLVIRQIQKETLFPWIRERIIMLPKFACFCWWEHLWNTSTHVALRVFAAVKIIDTAQEVTLCTHFFQPGRLVLVSLPHYLQASCKESYSMSILRRKKTKTL